MIKFIEETGTGDAAPEVVENDPKDIYFEFFSNGKVKTNMEGEDGLSSSIESKDTLILNEAPQKMTELTDHKLTFSGALSITR
ncbi:hypothetical protein [Chryseobacterium lathyri]|uniref:Lipocalin-like domain-containing protein n=1 Tax=Chryseobacterium lathyri TaxID=395933 RepID=A0ABT9SQV1_9FLAO|nr:hypothetical protein [Chryseobacterium lathyri]MDP9961823.1 hypothetical protein [Chryseobacterium lathyri]MDQ0064239.1 hypothetical protein [Chryseobacterium lathyri]